MFPAGARKVLDHLIDRQRMCDCGVNAIMVGGQKNIAIGTGREYWRHQDMVEAHVLATVQMLRPG